MIKHIVMWKLKDSAEGNTKTENASILKVKLEDLKSVISGIDIIEFGIGFDLPGSSWDVVLYTEFSSQDDLDIYQSHPRHLEVGSFVKLVASERAAVDYIV